MCLTAVVRARSLLAEDCSCRQILFLAMLPLRIRSRDMILGPLAFRASTNSPFGVSS